MPLILLWLSCYNFSDIVIFETWEKKLLFVPTENVTENRHPRMPPPTHAISQLAALRVGKHGPAYGWCYQESFAGWLFPHVLAIPPSSSRNNNSKKHLRLQLVPAVLLHHFCFSISGSFLFYHLSFFLPKWLNPFFPPQFSFPPRRPLWGNATLFVAMEP